VRFSEKVGLTVQALIFFLGLEVMDFCERQWLKSKNPAWGRSNKYNEIYSAKIFPGKEAMSAEWKNLLIRFMKCVI